MLKGEAPTDLLETYNIERQHGAEENILNSTRATDFITPKSRVSRVFRDTVLELAEHYPFARSLVNSGRLSLPCRYDESPLNGPDETTFPADLRPGSPAKDAPIRLCGQSAWLLNQFGNRFVLLLDGRLPTKQAEALAPELESLLESQPDLDLLVLGPASRALSRLPRTTLIEDADGLIDQRYGLIAGSSYLIRPDQHVTARWTECDPRAIAEAVDRALGKQLSMQESRHATA